MTPIDEGIQPTVLILDLRDRMARIETKLDGHHAAHNTIDKRLEDLEVRADSTDKEIASAKARFATVASIGGVVVTIIGLLGDHLWTLFSR